MPSFSVFRSVLFVVFGIFPVTHGISDAADWPTFRGNNARTSASDEQISLPLKATWKFESSALPELAWTDGKGRVFEDKLIGNRTKFDDVFHPVVVSGKLYFGATDDQLHCMDLKTGKTEWTYFTGAPVRLAPSIVDGRVYFGSDDGHVYCVDAATGQLQWQFRAGPKEDWLIGRGEMISRWPVRTGVLVDDGVAYFGAGVFPHENVYLYAVNADSGSVIWKQDNLSAEDAGRNDLSPQGYLLATDDLLFVPSGRSLPAAFERRTGKLVHKRTHAWRKAAGGVVGGTNALLADGQIYSGGEHHLLAMEQKGGEVGFGWFAGHQMSVIGAEAYVATGSMVARLDRETYAVNSRERHRLELVIYDLTRLLRSEKDDDRIRKINEDLNAANEGIQKIANIGITWQKETADDGALLATPNLLFLGGQDQVTAYSTENGETKWQSKVEGLVSGLAVSDGYLIVSTDTGCIYSFSNTDPAETAPPGLAAFPTSPTYAKAAEEILAQTGITRGFCMVIDGEEGKLAYELARQSELEIYVVESDPAKVATARSNLSKSGVYGNRVTVHQFDAADIPYSNYFANLIVSDRFVLTGETSTDPALVIRHLKPAGGVMCIGQPEKTESAGAVSVVTKAIASKDITAAETTQKSEAGWATVSRGMLPGAGDWSHQYGNPANTAVSNDLRVKGGLGVLWYGDPGLGEMVNRHDGAVGPLAVGGRLIVQGESTIRAYDAYNGLFLWNHDNPEGVRTGVYMNVSPGNLAASNDRLYHFIADQCIELDAVTGKTLRVHRLPKSRDDGNHQWAYVAVQDDILFGTATVMESIDARERRRGRRTKDATDGIFAIDLKTGNLLWEYHGDSISHHTIAIGPKSVYFVDSTITSEQRAELLRQDKSHLESLTGEDREIAEDRLKKADLRRVVAIDSRSGEQLWSNPVDVTDCSEIGIGGGMLTLMYQNDTLILCGANANGHYWKQFVAGEFSRRRLVALSAADGYKLWAKDANYRHRPILVGNKVLAEPWMFDLQTGEQQTRKHPITGEEVPWSMMRTGHHCGMLTAADSGMVMFRSGFTGFMDLEKDAGVRHFAGHRLGCWINAIPANGLVMIPEASAGCVCLFSIASTIVLEPREERQPWAIYSSVGVGTPVRHLALNIGAPGDRKDAHGTVWLSYPRYSAYQETSLDVKLDLQAQFTEGGGYEAVNEDTTLVKGSTTPWLYTSWASGLRELTLPLLGPNDPPMTFSVQLHFADARNGTTEAAVFDVQFNDTTVLTDVTLPKAGEHEAIPVTHSVSTVSVKDNLKIALIPKKGVPLLNAVQVIRDE